MRDGVLQVICTGVAWRDLPERTGLRCFNGFGIGETIGIRLDAQTIANATKGASIDRFANLDV